MAETLHHYRTTVTWTGNQGSGTSAPAAYSRAHRIKASGKPAIEGSSDPAFRGDKTQWNPEELLLASLSACHQLWYLDLCARAGVIVTAYSDHAEGIMTDFGHGNAQFTAATLHPFVTITMASDPEKAKQLHHDAHKYCFIARSVNFPVGCEPVIQVAAMA